MKNILGTILISTILLLSRLAAGQAAPESLDVQLLWAATWGHTAQVEQLLRQGAKTEAKDVVGNTALFCAMEGDYTQIVKLLLDHGADIEAKGSIGETPLFWASYHGKAESVKLLLDHGAGVGDRDKNGNTPLLVAANAGEAEAVRVLLDNGADIEARDKSGETALIIAARQCYVDVAKMLPVVKLLLDRGANIEAKSGGDTPLVGASYYGRTEIVKLLLERGANAEATDDHGVTPLIRAAGSGFTEIVKLLLVKVSGTEELNSALIVAARWGYTQVVKLLLDKGANIEARESDGTTALLAAAAWGKTDVVALLIEKGANLNAKDNQQQTATMLADHNHHPELAAMLRKVSEAPTTRDVNALAQSTAFTEKLNSYLPDLQKGVSIDVLLDRAVRAGDADVAAVLIEKGANVNSPDTDGGTILIKAAKLGNAEMAKLLLDKGANIEAKAQYGRTALIYAITDDRMGIVKLLLEKGANTEAKDNAGETALTDAISNDKIDAMKALLAKGANVEARDQYGETMLIYAISNNKIDVAKLLLENGVNIDGKDSHDDTALMVAARGGRLELAKLLLDHGATIDMIGRFGATALIEAAYNGKSAVVKLLLDKGADVGIKDQSGHTALGWETEQFVPLLSLDSVDQRQESLVKNAEVVRLLQQAVARNPQTFFDASLDAFKKADYEEEDARREIVIKAVEGLPNLPVIPEEARQLGLQASALLKQASISGELEQPIQLLRQALEIAPWWANAYYNLSRAFELSGQYDEAIKQLNYYLELKPSEADATEARAHIAVIQAEKEAAARKGQEGEGLLAVKYVSGGVTRVRDTDAPKWWYPSNRQGDPILSYRIGVRLLYAYWAPEQAPFFANVFRMPNGKLLAITLVAQANNGAFTGDKIGVYDITDSSCVEGNDFAFATQDYTTPCGGRYYVSVSNQPNATVTVSYPATGASVTLPVALLYRGRALQGRGPFGGCSGTVHQGGTRNMVLNFDCSVVKAAEDPTVNAAGLTPTTVKPE
jgi:ankyrin repeat protein